MSRLQNFIVPFNIPIPGGMCPGKMVVVQGKIPSMSQRFAVNLLTHSGDIALHVCPKFKENRVIRNNVLNMNWGPEESHGSMPVFPGQSFEMFILCESYSFKISFNGHHFCEFSHRLPFNTVSNLAVDGDVVVHNINFQEPNSYGNNNNFSNSLPYGFQADPPSNNYKPSALYPSIDSYPYPPAPSSSVPHYPASGEHNYLNPNPPHYSSSGGPGYPTTGVVQNPTFFPTQPSYPTMPHQGPYPQVPRSNTGGTSPAPQNKPGFLDQAGATLAGVLGPSLLAGGLNRYSGHGKPNLLDEAGRALAGAIGGSGLAGIGGKAQKGTQPQPSTPQTGFLDQAGTALAGILGGAGLMGATSRSSRGVAPVTPMRQTQPGSILDQAGSALAGILGGGGLTGVGRSQRGILPSSPTAHPQSRLLDQAGSALAELLGGGGSRDNRNNQRNRDFIVLKFFQHRNHKKMGILGGALGTAVAGAALTGHLNPIKATKKQLKAQKKALKYGLPIAGVGLGAYALHKGLKKGFRRSSSSSSCSSSD